MEKKITVKQGYEAMILMLFDYYKTTDSVDITDILSGGEYENGKPADIAFWYMWEEAVNKILNGTPPKEKKWIG